MKSLVATALFAVMLAGSPAEARAQTFGGSYGGYGNNGYLDRALALRRSKRKVRSSKRSYRKQQARRKGRSRRTSRP